jgi:cytochrome c553
MMKEPRQHDEAHLAFLRTLLCVVCLDNTSVEAAHYRKADARAAKRYTGKGEKPHDRWALPLCSRCHGAQHDMGEDRFWDIAMIDPVFVALALHSVSGDAEKAETIIRAQH